MQANFEACIYDKSIIIFTDYLVLKDQWWGLLDSLVNTACIPGATIYMNIDATNFLK